MKNDNLYFTDDNLYRVIISKEAYEYMHKCCKNSNCIETGGILVGNYSDDQKTANILKVTPPQNSQKTRASFRRGSIGLKDILDSMWLQGLYYLGEWHYHPQASPYPSRTDINQMLKFASNSELKCPEPILVIVGEDSKRESIFVGVFSKNDYVQLQEINM